MRALRIILITLAFIAFQAQAKDDGRNLVVKQNSSTGKRIALVIGNGNYQHPDSLPKLANPTHDAEDIAKALRGFGFEVIEKKDQSLEGMSDAITEFSRKIGDSEAALFYFAGHGLQVKGQNYLVPVDARIETEAQVSFKSINVNLILEEMDSGKNRANIVILDACRNNPISGKFRSGATRGLAAITSQPKGTVIVYATDPGNVAADGIGRNGLFTAGLLTAFKGSDLSLGGVLTRASEEVERASEKKQTPYVNGPMTLQKSFQFGQGPQVASLVPVPAQPAAHVKSHEEIEQDTWDSVRDSGSISSIQEYLKQYPKGRFVGQAKVLIANLKSTPTKPAEPVTSSPAREDNETALWTEAQKGNSKDDYDAYLGQYPKGKYAALAKARLKKLDEETARQAAQARAEAAQGPKVGTTFRDCAECPEMVVIPAGSFDMGSNSGYADEKPVHHVTLVKPFAIGKTEVTQGQWKAVMGNNPSEFSNCGDTCPVENVSWNDAKEFIQKLNSKTGKQYRLPSEAEWEYACRAGGTYTYCGSDNLDSVAWYGFDANPKGNSGKTTNRVATKQANAWGLYDMSGNVWEWVEDSYHANYNGAPADGTAWQGDGAKRVRRGGSWSGNYYIAFEHSTTRGAVDPGGRGYSDGFRVARTLP